MSSYIGGGNARARTAPVDVVASCLALVAPAEQAFRSRWRLSTLKRVDSELYGRLCEQIDLYNVALVTGSDAEAQRQAEAMVRGWRAACAALEAPLQPDDAYLTGIDYHTGLHVVIGEQQASIARVQVRDGRRVVFVTPDEVAKLVAGVKILAEAKSCFPDAEVIEIYPDPDAA